MSDLAEVSAAQQTAGHVNVADLASVVTVAVTEALKAVGVGQTTPLASPFAINPSPGSVDASATVKTATAAEIAKRKTYELAWNNFLNLSNRYCGTAFPQLPLSVSDIVYFVAYLSAKKLAPSTIST